jgi:hypothetical protein
MFFKSKKVSGSIYFIVCCSGMYVTKAMEQEEPTSKRRKIEEFALSSLAISEKKTEEEASPWAKLPSELKAYIISFLGSAENKEKAVKTIKALSLASRELYTIVNDPTVLGGLIVEISNQYGKSLIEVALEFKDLGILDWLKNYIQHRPQEQEALDMFLLEAVRKNNSSHLIAALKAGADVNKADRWDITPFHFALLSGNKNIVKLLIKAGANAHYFNNIGYGASVTPLSYVICSKVKNKKDIIELLLNAGAQVNEEDIMGSTPLFQAITIRNKDTIELLIQYGADVNHIDSLCHRTPLSLAVKEGHKDIVELLLNAGANVNQADKYGDTPLSLAIKEGHKDIEELLRKYGAIQ